MRRELSDSEVIGACGGIIGALVVAGVAGSLRPVITQANAVLLLVLVVVGAAYVGGRWAGGATALAAVLAGKVRGGAIVLPVCGRNIDARTHDAVLAGQPDKPYGRHVLPTAA